MLLFHDFIIIVYGKKITVQDYRCKKDETTKKRSQTLSKGSPGIKIDIGFGRATGLR